jgi:hypothetical protein
LATPEKNTRLLTRENAQLACLLPWWDTTGRERDRHRPRQELEQMEKQAGGKVIVIVEPKVKDTAAYVVWSVLARRGYEMGWEEAATLFQLYMLLTVLKEPETERPLFTALVENLPPKIQSNLYRRVYKLTDPKAALLTDILRPRKRTA